MTLRRCLTTALAALTVSAAVLLGGCAGPTPTTPAAPVTQVASAPATAPVTDAPVASGVGVGAGAGNVPVIATGALAIQRLGWSEQVGEEVPWDSVLRPAGHGLARVAGMPVPWNAGELYVIHSGGDQSNPGNALVTRDHGSNLVVGDAVTLPDGSAGVVTRTEVAPKSDLPEWLWAALAEGHTVLVTCRPETGRSSSNSNAIVVIERV